MPLADARADETVAPAAPVPRVPFYMMHVAFARVATHVSVRLWKPVPKAKAAAADAKPGHAAAMKSGAATRIRVAPRK